MKTRIVSAILAVLLGFLLAAAVRAESTNREPTGITIGIDVDKKLPPEVVEKLTPEQLHELMKIRLAKTDEIPGLAPIIVAIVFGMPVAIVAVVLWFRQRRNRQLHQTLALMIEKGVPIPPELLQPEQKRRPSDLRRGVVLIAVGAGLIGFFLAQKQDAWGLGLIPLLIGVGYLIVWKLDQRKQAG